MININNIKAQSLNFKKIKKKKREAAEKKVDNNGARGFNIIIKGRT